MKLLFLTGSRGEWGYIRPILRLCREEKIEFRLCATNMHLVPTFGLSINEIRADGFEVSDEIYMSLEGHNHFTMAKSMGIGLMSMVDMLQRHRPDWLVLAGDRGEQLMGAIAGAYTYTPVAHIQAGELSGNIDGQARHAIGKFAHLHFASNEDARDRLRKLGEEEFRIKLVGAPQLDEITQGAYASKEHLEENYHLDLSKPYVVIAQHPVTEEFQEARAQIEATVEAMGQLDMTKIWILPNNDAGSDVIKNGILGGRKGRSYVFENLPRGDFLGLLKGAQALVGNSSAGLLEAPSFRVPAVNLGRRQANRLQGANVINADFKVPQILAAVNKAMGADFRKTIRDMVNPYGNGDSSPKILEILKEMPRDSKLLCKQLTY